MAITHESLKSGDLCPSCVAEGAAGKVYAYDAGCFLRLVGQPLVTGTRYKLQGFRCNLCSEIFKPEVPSEIKDAPKFAASAVSQIALAHYNLGLPFYRIEQSQNNLGVPLSDATQWNLMEKLAVILAPVFTQLQILSANTLVMSYDDTSLKILALKKGLTTAVASRFKSYMIYLFYTSERCAGREVKKLLTARETDEPLITMTDASPQNQLTEIDETLLARLVIAYCLVHGRRKFHELLEMHPEESNFVLECIADVYRFDAHCMQQQYSPARRLQYHQTHSRPVMDALHLYLRHWWQYHRGEHNSPFGQAVGYLLKRWSALTRFLTVADCPIDNSLCERAIKIIIRYRKNSLFYKTLRGAICGDKIMSVIYTAQQNGINAFLYLNALQTHADLVAVAPQDFLPWNYQATMVGLSKRYAA